MARNCLGFIGSGVGSVKGFCTQTDFEQLYVTFYFKSIPNWQLEANDEL